MTASGPLEVLDQEKSIKENTPRWKIRYFNRFIVLMWRLGLGKWVNAWPSRYGQIMVIVQAENKSRLRQYTPVNYAMVNEDIFCTTGLGQIPDWYRNILANPAVEIWLPDSWWAGIGEDVTGQKDSLAIIRKVLTVSGVAVRSLGVDPTALDDEQLAAATSSCHLVRIRRTVARTGEGGPGDLAWIWPLSTLFLLFLQLFRPRRR